VLRDRYGRPGKGSDKGNAEGLVGFSRRNVMVPVPRFAAWEAFNDHLEAQCRKRQDDVLRGQTETIGERLARDLAAMSALPAAPVRGLRPGRRTGQLAGAGALQEFEREEIDPVDRFQRRMSERCRCPMAIVTSGSAASCRRHVSDMTSR
jgi:hypothetical protein